MPTEETRTILDRAIFLPNKYPGPGMEKYEAIADQLIAEDVVSHGPVEDDHGREAWKQSQVSFLNAFPDLEVTIEASLADGEMRFDIQ